MTGTNRHCEDVGRGNLFNSNPNHEIPRRKLTRNDRNTVTFCNTSILTEL
jgi:hypothetical protein